jgi:hypothetical protein
MGVSRLTALAGEVFEQIAHLYARPIALASPSAMLIL